MWASARHINYGVPPEFFFVAPASSFHHHHHDATAVATTGADPSATISFDPHTLNASNAIGVGVGVFPLLTATPCLAPPGIAGATDEDVLNAAAPRGRRGMQLWQHQHQFGPNSSSYSKKLVILEPTTNLLEGGDDGIRGSSSIGAVATCQDCGNQAKKDCPHRRCRTCCKSRRYDCSTHVKSTWVPASRRRERQLMGGSNNNAGVAAGSSQSTSGSKKPRLGGVSQTTTTASHTSTSNTTPARSFDTNSSHQDAGFKESLPGQVRAPAVFKCVRVTALDDGEDEYAYQALVRIGGHVFKGFLYDQGLEGREGLPNLSQLYLGGSSGGAAGGGGRNNAASSSPPVLDPSGIYAAAGSSGGELLGGSSYGNPIN